MRDARELQALLAEIVDYNPSTGLFVWREKPRHLFASEARYRAANTQCLGKPAFCTRQSTGYLAGSVQGAMYLAHRIAWVICFGEWPGQIDHINGDKTDNRIGNLRAVSAAINNRNLPRSKTNRSGVTGVRWHKAAGKWIARINVNKQEHHLGLFGDFEAAVAARKAAEVAYGFHPNHGRAA